MQKENITQDSFCLGEMFVSEYIYLFSHIDYEYI